MVFVFTPWVALIDIEQPECESAFVHQFSKDSRSATDRLKPRDNVALRADIVMGPVIRGKHSDLSGFHPSNRGLAPTDRCKCKIYKDISLSWPGSAHLRDYFIIRYDVIKYGYKMKIFSYIAAYIT